MFSSALPPSVARIGLVMDLVDDCPCLWVFFLATTRTAHVSSRFWSPLVPSAHAYLRLLDNLSLGFILCTICV